MDARQLLVVGATMLATLGAPAFAQDTKEAYVRVAEIEIDPAQLEAYKAAVKEQIEAAVQLEAGVLALYSVADKDNPAHVFVFEMYADIDAYMAHLETAHFKKYHPGHGEVPQAAGYGANPAGRQAPMKQVRTRSACLAIAFFFGLGGPLMAEERIVISSAWGEVRAELADNEAARSLLRMLPITIQMRDHLRQEKTGR